MYCEVFIPTGPRFLSADAMVICGFCLMALRIYCWAVDRFVVLGPLMKEVRMELQNRMILVSIFGGGRGALHVDFTLSMELIDNAIFRGKGNAISSNYV